QPLGRSPIEHFEHFVDVNRLARETEPRAVVPPEIKEKLCYLAVAYTTALRQDSLVRARAAKREGDNAAIGLKRSADRRKAESGSAALEGGQATAHPADRRGDSAVRRVVRGPRRRRGHLRHQGWRTMDEIDAGQSHARGVRARLRDRSASCCPRD